MLQRQQQKWRWVFKQRHLQMFSQTRRTSVTAHAPSSEMFSRWNLTSVRAQYYPKEAWQYHLHCLMLSPLQVNLSKQFIWVVDRDRHFDRSAPYNPAWFQSVAFSCMCSSSCCVGSGHRGQASLGCLWAEESWWAAYLSLENFTNGWVPTAVFGLYHRLN